MMLISCKANGFIPDAANSCTGLLVMLDMKPTMEKMTNPANMLVQELMQHTMMESLQRTKKRNEKRRDNMVKQDIQSLWFHGSTCKRRYCKSCNFPGQWVSQGPDHMKRRSELLHPATPVRQQIHIHYVSTSLPSSVFVCVGEGELCTSDWTSLLKSGVM